MREVLYTKYNSKRKSVYQLSTSIVEDEGKKFAIKKAIQPRAELHLNNLLENRKKLELLYKDIQLVDCQKEKDAILFPFVDGCHYLDNIDFVNGSLEDILSELKQGLERITSYKEEMICTFQMTEGFRNIFEGCEPKEDEAAIRIANVDSIFENFVVLEDGNLCCIDYEWVYDFPIPQKYITFRNVYYFYHNNESYLRDKMSQTAFYQYFGYTEEDIELYIKMENAFQQHVHGRNWEYMYLERYKKDTKIWAAVEADMRAARRVEIQNEEIERLSKDVCNHIEEIEHLREEVKYWAAIAEEQNAHIVKLKKAMKNPFYALRLLIGKINSKLKR